MICRCKILVLLAVIGFCSFFYYKSCRSDMSVKLISNQTDFSEEKSTFLKAYSFLYSGITDQLKMDDLQQALNERFEKEKELIIEKDNGIVGVSVFDEERNVAFFSFDNKELEESIRMRRCAIDPESKIEDVVKNIKNFIFKKFEKINSIKTIVLKSSNVEKRLLMKFGFKPIETVFEDYDPEKYVVFELRGSRACIPG